MEEEATTSAPAVPTNLDQVYLIVNGIFVFMMVPGFALLECGAVRAKNATNILFVTFIDALIAGVSYWILGYAFAYGSGNVFMGLDKFALFNLSSDHLAHWFFQYVFAITTATIVSGAVAERCATPTYLVYSFVITGFIYPVVTHWAWTDEGWLAKGDGIGHFKDFAGSGVVHLVGGTCALVGCIFVGPRLGRFPKGENQEVDEEEFRGHSLPMTVGGGLILMVCFLPFNGGSVGGLSKPGQADLMSKAVVNTVISGCVGGLVVVALGRLGAFGKPRVFGVMHPLNGVLISMVSVCAGANELAEWGAAANGAGAAVFYLFFHWAMVAAKLDDPLDAVAVHAGGGLWGLISAPLFSKSTGVLVVATKISLHMLLWNMIGAVAIFAWSSMLMFIVLGLLHAAGQLRSSDEEQYAGLDDSVHREPAYPNLSKELRLSPIRELMPPP